jgi:hypothetical protein
MVRPTVTEQLDGMAHILREVVAPAVPDAYAATILAGIADSLTSLARAEPLLAGFLEWDAAATASILEHALPTLDGPAAAAAASALEASEDRWEALRGALQAAVPAIMEQPELRDAMVEHFRQRAVRFPR